MTEPLPMSVQCGSCSAQVYNDDPELTTPFDFIKAMEARGWRVPTNPPSPPTCPSCIAKGA